MAQTMQLVAPDTLTSLTDWKISLEERMCRTIEQLRIYYIRGVLQLVTR